MSPVAALSHRPTSHTKSDEEGANEPKVSSAHIIIIIITIIILVTIP